MTQDQLDLAARALYDACETPKPTWESLGETTKGVWRGYVLTGSRFVRDQVATPR